jgi:hypothetical protein
MSILKEDGLGGAVACTGEMRNAYKSFVEKPEGKKSLWRPKYRWEDIKGILNKQDMRVYLGLNWFKLESLMAFVNMVINLQVP